MSETAVVDRMFGETRLALLDPDGRLLEIHHFRDEDALRPGDIHRGRVTAAAPALGGAFVSIGAETVLLKAPPRAIPPEGSPVVVTIRRLARPPKLATAALCDSPPGHEVAGPPGLLFREAEPWLALLDARGTERIGRILVEEPELRAAAMGVPWAAERLVMERKPEPLMARLGIEAEIEALASPAVPLPGGGRITIEETQALTAIDVDAGTATGRDERSTARGVNAAAAREIARQLRLRRIGGLVVVDFLRLRNPKDRERLIADFTAALASLPWNHAVGRFSRFGLLDLEIAHPGRSLAAEIAAPEAAGRFNLATLARRALRAALTEARANPGRPVAIRTRNDALARRIMDLCPGEAFLRLAGAPLEIVVDQGLDSSDYDTYLRSKG